MRYDLRDMDPRIYAIEKIEEAMQLCEQECKCLSDGLAKPLMKAIEALRLPRRHRIAWYGPSLSDVMIALHDQGMSQAQIAARIGCSQPTVSRAVNPKTLTT